MVLTLVAPVKEHRTIEEIHLKLGFAPSSLRAAEQSVIVICHNYNYYLQSDKPKALVQVIDPFMVFSAFDMDKFETII